MKLAPSLEENVQNLENIFKDCGDVVKRKFPVGADKSLMVYVFYIDMLVDRSLIERTVMETLMIESREVTPSVENATEDIFSFLKDGGISTADLKDSEDLDEISLAILSGDTVLFISNCTKAIIISTKGWPNRGIPKVESEVVVQGSKEAFSEVFRFNTTLIRRRIRDPKLKIKQVKVGRRSSTDVAVMYLEDVVRPKILNTVLDRINNIDVDGIFDVGNIEQFIEDDWQSPFPQIQVTERPDKASSAIMEGRIAIIVDNSPYALIVPSVINCFFQASEDYYQRFHIMAFTRILRYIASFFAISLPALYIAITLYSPAMLPTMLTYKFAAARQTIPFPATLEVIILDVAFELLREAGIRMPGPVGSTIGIVGGLIVGQAAVQAGIVSPIVVIIVALTAICSFTIPQQSLINGYRIMKYFLIILSALLGMFGFLVGLILILTHLVSLKSFGIPFMFPFASGDINGFSDLKDSLFRMPIHLTGKRPIFANPNQQNRIDKSKTGNIREKE